MYYALLQKARSSSRLMNVEPVPAMLYPHTESYTDLLQEAADAELLLRFMTARFSSPELLSSGRRRLLFPLSATALVIWSPSSGPKFMNVSTLR